MKKLLITLMATTHIFATKEIDLPSAHRLQNKLAQLNALELHDQEKDIIYKHDYKTMAQRQQIESYKSDSNNNASDGFGGSVFVPRKLGVINLIYNHGEFIIEKNKKHYEIKSYDIDPLLRKISPEKLTSFLKCGYISVNRLDNKDYTLKAHVRGQGGGWITGVVLGNAVRVVGYGTIGFAGTTLASKVIGTTAIGALIAKIASFMPHIPGAESKIAIVVEEIISRVIKSGIGSIPGSEEVVAMLVEKGLETQIANTYAFVLATTIKAEIVAIVEGAAISTQVFFTAIPWLP